MMGRGGYRPPSYFSISKRGYDRSQTNTFPEYINTGFATEPAK